MNQIRLDLDQILSIICQKLSYEDYDKVFNLVQRCNHNLDLVKRIEENEPISKTEYFYYEYSLPVKLTCLRHLLYRTRSKDNE